MKSMLTAFAALAALAIPAGLPTLASAQELTADAPPPANDAGGRYQPDESAPPPQRAFQERAEQRPEPQQVQDRRGGGRGEGGGRGDGGGRRGGGDGGWSGGQNNGGGDRGGRGGDRGRNDNGGGGWNRGGDNNGGGRGDRGPGQGGDPRWHQPNPTPPVVVPPAQNGGGYDRDRDGSGRTWNSGGDRGRDRDRGNGGWNGGNDNRGQDWNRGNEGRDRGNGGWNNGQNNGGWDRDRNGGNRNWRSDRNGRRDYNGWNNRWNQNDWRRDWNRGRSNDWWRSDRGFRGYTGYRFGFYFAPNYGYYSVPRNYWGQRWYQGDYLPSIFWRYQLNDYRTYGLGYPPPGTQWVAVDTTIYLIDSFDGYILEVIYDAWRW